jgi:hypothetical protein
MNSVITLLQNYNYVPDGHTQSDTFKIITKTSYPLAGDIVTLGGRLRFKRGLNNYATVGKRVTCFYNRNEKGEPVNFKTFQTKNQVLIENFLKGGSHE